MKKPLKKIISALLLLLSLSCLSACLPSSDTQQNSATVGDTEITAQQKESEIPEESTTEEITEATSEEVTEDPNAGLTKAPELTVSDINGKTVKLSDFFGKPIVLNFWASWCPPCIGEFPSFAEVCREYDGEVVFLFVNCFDGATETMRTVQSFINSNGYSDLPIYLDKTGARQAYGVSAIPFTFFINEDGYIVNSLNTPISKDRLLTEIEKIYVSNES